jgi:rSAM-associated Gly-rich repeat protein
MTLRNRTLKALSVLLPAGALGMSVALASAPATAAAASGQNAGASDTAGEGVAARLRAIRSGVSEMILEVPADGAPDHNIAKAWWGNVGGWRPGWGNGGWGWRNGGWGNGGWRNGWGNGGWRNGWPNYWHNW